MGALFRISQIACAALLITPATGFAMGMFGSSPPSAMSLTDASHPTNPIMVQSLVINGHSYGHPPYLASSDWENPRGGNGTSTGLRPPVQDGSVITVQAEWVEVYSNRAYSAEITVPDGEITIKDIADLTAYVTVVFGRNGHLAISTDTGPDAETGQYNGTIVAEVCGDRQVEDDVDYRTRPDADVDLDWVYSQQAKRANEPQVATPCKGEAG